MEMFLQICENPSNSCSKSDLSIATIKVHLSAQLILWEPGMSGQNSILIHPVAVEIFLELTGQLNHKTSHIFTFNISIIIMMLLGNRTQKIRTIIHQILFVSIYKPKHELHQRQHRAETLFSAGCVRNKNSLICTEFHQFHFCFWDSSEPSESTLSFFSNSDS